VPEDELVYPRRNRLEAVTPLGVADGEIGVLKDTDGRMHPGMNIAADINPARSRRQLLLDASSLQRHGEVEERPGVEGGFDVLVESTGGEKAHRR